MKHIVWAVLATVFIFTSTAGYSRGFSVGVFGAYSIDGGMIEKTIDEEKILPDQGNASYVNQCKYEEIKIPGAGLFAGYTFSNGFAIRVGSEYYKMISGGEIYKTVMGDANNHDINIQYEAFAFPILLGMTLSPDKGKTNIYSYAGLILTRIEIKQHYSFSNGAYWYNSENGNFIPGFGALVGIEKRIFAGMYFAIEYAFYKCELTREETGSWYYGGEYKYTENYGLPHQQVRVGVKYQF